MLVSKSVNLQCNVSVNVYVVYCIFTSSLVVIDYVNVLCQFEDLAMISAQQYYVDYGLDLTVDRLSSLLPLYLPDSYIDTQKDVSYWIQVGQRHATSDILYFADVN